MIGRERVTSESLTAPDVWAWSMKALKAVAHASDYDTSLVAGRAVLAQLDDAAVRRVALALAMCPRYCLPGNASERVIDKVALDIVWKWSQ